MLIHYSHVEQSLHSLLALVELDYLLFQLIFLLFDPLGLLEELLSILLEVTFKLSHFFHLLSGSLSFRIFFHHISGLTLGGYMD
jgi:hypothetical protein